jgi:large subunit GTPase 1
MNDRFGKGKGADRKRASAVTRTNHATGEQYLVNERQDAAWVKMRSITEQSAMDEFLATAELAGTDFTAEKKNSIKIIQMDGSNPYLLSAADERMVLRRQAAHTDKLTVPRRPRWNETTTREELERAEMDMFYKWRQVLSDLVENNDLLLTPFERNLEVWRQLWRVIERSDLVVQIVDARNPLAFRSEDLETYVQEIDPKKQNLLLINKADMLTLKQREAWASYLKEAGIAYRYFSASLAQEMNNLRDEDSDLEDQESAADTSEHESRCEDEHEEDDTRILTVDELEEMLLQYAPESSQESDRKFTVGLVGYPNVGKSSTINALVGAKKVSVSATPGKTKHFQTIHLSDKILLCDCPGLVFPYFATTKADLVTNGVLPIDQAREFTGPIGLIAQRIPKMWLEAIYGFSIKTRPIEEGGTGQLTAEELSVGFAKGKGIIAKYGRPDEGLAARIILKDYVKGKLLWCHPPPGVEDAVEFNRDLYDINSLTSDTKRAAFAKKVAALSLAEDGKTEISDEIALAPASGSKSKKIDRQFFGPSGSHASMPFNYKYSEQGKEKEVQLAPSKKHFKGGVKGGKKTRRGQKNPYNNDSDG